MKLIVPLLIAATIAGCGGQSATPTASTTAWTEADVMRLANITTDGITYTLPNGCEAAVIMTTPAAVDTYVSAGDTVAVNPDGTVGVKIIDDKARCVGEWQRALEAVGP